jgi:uncharacterized protein (TIGR03435 family)
MLGVAVLSLRFAGGWISAVRLRSSTARLASHDWQRTLSMLAERIGVWRPVRLLVSARIDSPVVVGWMRPMILAPVGALCGLPAAQMEALLLHELAHVRRHDYLVNLMQNVAESLLFYHPAVWWISAHVRAEREVCCDDLAVAATGDAFGFACALAEIASWQPVRRHVALAASGGSLSARIARLLGVQRPATGSAGPLLMIVVTLLFAAYAFAQSEPRPSFGAASVKLNTDVNARGMQIHPYPGGRFTSSNAPIVMIIQAAYQVQAYQIIGGPSWMNTDGYDIDAKPEGEADVPKARAMLQTLLAERFKLAIHRETRELPVWNLAPGKNGLRLTAANDPGCTPISAEAPPPEPNNQGPCGKVRINFSPGGLSFTGRSVSIAEIVFMLAAMMGKPVIDKTGFSGVTDINVTGFFPDETTLGLPGSGGPRSLGVAPPLPPNPEQNSVINAFEQQVGLKLTAGKGPVEVLVIDRVERPSAN